VGRADTTETSLPITKDPHHAGAKKEKEKKKTGGSFRLPKAVCASRRNHLKRPYKGTGTEWIARRINRWRKTNSLPTSRCNAGHIAGRSSERPRAP